MQIIRVEDNVRKSKVDRVEVSELPKGLRIRMVRLLNKLKEVKQINIKGKTQDALFEFMDRNVILKSFDKKIKKEFLNTIELLRWYLGKHWYSMSPPGAIGGDVCCADCNYSRIAGSPELYCPSLSCPSHQKWRMVIGPLYKPPKKDPLFSLLQ